VQYFIVNIVIYSLCPSCSLLGC